VRRKNISKSKDKTAKTMSLKMNASMERLANEIRICQKERETLADLLAAVSGEDQKVQLIKIQAHEPLFKELMELRASTQDAEDILEEKEEELTDTQDELEEAWAENRKEIARADALEKELHLAKKMNAIHVKELDERTEKLVAMTLEQDALKEQVETMSQMLEDLVDLTGADDDADIYPAIQVMKSEFYRELDDMPAGYTERRPNFFDGV
tara:strand:- start:1122 stop:1754 length:633 start_codon:yes stop_codon:yes gene_type:complete